MSDTEGASAPVAAAPVAGSFTVETAVQETLKHAQNRDGLSRGLNEAVRALERRDALCCILAENCDEANYVRLIEALCVEHSIPILKIGDNKTLGEWAGLCKIDREGNAVKVVGCSCVVVREVDDNSAWDFLQTHLKKH
jgi:small subunit ribosomal protein S12e